MKRLPAGLLSVSAAIVSLVLFSSSSPAATYVSDFANGFDGWQQEWHKESDTGTPGLVTHSTKRGFNDTASLEFDMGDGLGDDGTLWIEKLFSIDPGVPTHVSVAFEQFSPFQSDFNTFEVKAAISTANPSQQADFTTIGTTDSLAGWAPFAHDQLITSAMGEVWVAVGIRVAWETPREYWIDRVVVTTTPVPEPGLVVGMVLAGVVWVGWRGVRGRASER